MKEKDESKAKGGIARAESLTPEARSEIAKKAAEKRWSMPQAEYTGILKLGDVEFPCAVLSDGTRVLTETDFMDGMGMYRSGALSVRREQDAAGAQVPLYLAFKNLIPYINMHLGDVHELILKYKTQKGLTAHGIKADLIPKICDVWIDAQEDGVLGTRQEHVANNAKLMMRALAHVGIIALVDEATGYQEIRDRNALQIILDKYLTDEWAKWTKTFPDDFYKNLFRLKNVPYPIGQGGRKPSYVGHWTNDIVYSRLAPGVLKTLKEKNPRENHTTTRKRKHHQYLTRDYGHPALTEHLSNVSFLMSGCSTWDEFKKSLDRAKPKYGDTIEMDI